MRGTAQGLRELGKAVARCRDVSLSLVGTCDDLCGIPTPKALGIFCSEAALHPCLDKGRKYQIITRWTLACLVVLVAAALKHAKP